MSSKYTSVYMYRSHMNSHCEWCNTKNRNISFEYPPKSLLKSSNPKKAPAKINLPKAIPISKILIPKKSPGFPCFQGSPKNFISTPPNDDRFSNRGGSDFLFNEGNKIWTLDEYVACQDSWILL